jgi:hypothetical protein
MTIENTGLAGSVGTAGGSFSKGAYQPGLIDKLARDGYTGTQITDMLKGSALDQGTSGGLDGLSLSSIGDFADSAWDGVSSVLGNEGLMTGALGLASYLQLAPLYEEQLKGLRQNRQFAAENQQNRRNIASDLG